MTISLCAITKDEERFLDPFLQNMQNLVDEMIIVDTGSTDRTKEIARDFTKRIYDFKWNDDFSAARNFSISKAKGDWILWLDPDEFLHPKYFDEISHLTKKENFKGFSFLQKTFSNAILHPRFVPEPSFGMKGYYVRGVCKMFRNEDIKFEYPVHETVMNAVLKKGPIGRTKITIEHFSEKKGDPKAKSEYYLSLLEKKKALFPYSNADKEIEFENLVKTSF